MANNINKIALVGLSLTILGVAAPTRSMAQDDGGNTKQTDNISDRKIDVDLESTNLYYGLKLLFSQVKANFTIDDSLKTLTVTAHLTQVPFRIALETLLKSTSTPLTYKVENGIYSVVPKVEVETTIEPSNDVIDRIPAGGGSKFGIIRPNNVSAIDIVTAFGGHIVNVGYSPSGFGQGGLGGSNGQSGGLGGGVGGFGGGPGGPGGSNGFGGSNSGGYGNMGGSGNTGGQQSGSSSGFSGLHGF